MSALLGLGLHWCRGRGTQPSLGGRGHGLTRQRNNMRGPAKDCHPAKVPQSWQSKDIIYFKG